MSTVWNLGWVLHGCVPSSLFHPFFFFCIHNFAPTKSRTFDPGRPVCDRIYLLSRCMNVSRKIEIFEYHGLFCLSWRNFHLFSVSSLTSTDTLGVVILAHWSSSHSYHCRCSSPQWLCCPATQARNGWAVSWNPKKSCQTDSSTICCSMSVETIWLSSKPKH